jgi:hypothetical protein
MTFALSIITPPMPEMAFFPFLLQEMKKSYFPNKQEEVLLYMVIEIMC